MLPLTSFRWSSIDKMQPPEFFNTRKNKHIMIKSHCAKYSNITKYVWSLGYDTKLEISPSLTNETVVPKTTLESWHFPKNAT